MNLQPNIWAISAVCVYYYIGLLYVKNVNKFDDEFVANLTASSSGTSTIAP